MVGVVFDYPSEFGGGIYPICGNHLRKLPFLASVSIDTRKGVEELREEIARAIKQWIRVKGPDSHRHVRGHPFEHEPGFSERRTGRGRHGLNLPCSLKYPTAAKGRFFRSWPRW